MMHSKTSRQIGCIHFVKPTGSANIPVRLMLLIPTQTKAFVGLIPNDQSNFVLKIKEAYAHHKYGHGSNQQQNQQPVTSPVNTTNSPELCHPTSVPQPYLSSTNSGRPQNATQSVSQEMEQAMVSNSNQMSFGQQTHGELLASAVEHQYEMQRLEKRKQLQQQQQLMFQNLQHEIANQKQKQQLMKLRRQHILQQQLQFKPSSVQTQSQHLLQNQLWSQQQAFMIQSMNENEQQPFGSPQQQGMVPTQQHGTSSNEEQDSSSDHHQHANFSQQQPSSSQFSGQQFNPANFNFNG